MVEITYNTSKVHVTATGDPENDPRIPDRGNRAKTEARKVQSSSKEPYPGMLVSTASLNPMTISESFFDELSKIAEKEGCETAEKIVGGKGDCKDDDDFNKKQLRMGKKVEREHTKSKRAAGEIARDHLAENKKYYSKLKRAGLADELEKDGSEKITESFFNELRMLTGISDT